MRHKPCTSFGWAIATMPRHAQSRTMRSAPDIDFEGNDLRSSDCASGPLRGQPRVGAHRPHQGYPGFGHRPRACTGAPEIATDLVVRLHTSQSTKSALDESYVLFGTPTIQHISLRICAQLLRLGHSVSGAWLMSPLLYH